ncbi:MAG: serine hydrolase domain-containing protein [Hyphomicrobium sp.]
MTTRAIWLILFVLIDLLVCGDRRAISAEADRSLAARTSALIEAFMNQPTRPDAPLIPAMSVAVGRDGTLLYADGFGRANVRRAATARTTYMVGSLTKQFTAAAILRMIDNGAIIKASGKPLQIATPVADILDVANGWKLEGGPPMTVAHLLSMTSNLPNYTRRPPHELDPWGAVPARRLLTGLKEYRPSGYPGSFEYSNTSYFLLSEIMEDAEVAGASRSYHEILRQEVFERLGLSDTGFRDDPGISEGIAAPNYRRQPRFFQPDWLKGSGDVASSVVDIFKWDKALMEGDALSEKMREVMLSDAARVDVWTYYGAGWFITHKGGVDRYFHSGTVSGYTSYNLIVRPSGRHWISVSLLTNTDGVEDIDALADQIADVVLAQ